MAFEERMGQLRSRFCARAATQRLLLTAALQSTDREEIRRLAHSLSGSAGMFGYPDVSRYARVLEQALDHESGLDELRVYGNRLVKSLERAAQPI